MNRATRIKTGEYSYRGYELAVDDTGWMIKLEGMNHYPWDAESKKDAMALIDNMIEDNETRATNTKHEELSDEELYEADPWTWLDR